MYEKENRLLIRGGLCALVCVILLLFACGPAPCTSNRDCAEGFYCDVGLFVCYPESGRCEKGASRICYSGDLRTRGEGVCKDGVQLCVEDGRWGACNGDVTPTVEICDGRDNNCDGVIDENCADKVLCESISFQERIVTKAVLSKDVHKRVFVTISFTDVVPTMFFPGKLPVLTIESDGVWVIEKSVLSDDKKTLYYTLFSERDWFRTFRLRLRGESVLPGEKNKLCSYLYYSLTLQAQCDRGWSDCGGICRDTEHDPNYCGGCEQKCPRGRECCRGRCRQPVAPSRICGACDDICSIGKACCDGICQSLNENVTHCGACGVRCESGQRCCGYQCIDVLRNNEHCGLCGKKCPGNSKCCNGECVRLGNDKRHCGACGNTCQASEFCSLGRCQTCEPPNSLCSQTTTPQWPVCVDIRFSNRHCGACANNCATHEVCLNGRCGLCRQSLDCEEDPQCVLGSCKRDFYCSLLGRCKKPSSVNERGHLVLDDVGEVDAFDFQLDPAGRYLLAGSFRGGFTFQQRHLPSQGARDIFVGHYDPKGSSSYRLLWLKQIGGKGDDYGAKIVLTPTQRVSVLGVYGEGGKETTFVDIGNPSAMKLTPPTAANNGLFLASFSSAGTLLKVVPLHAGTSHLAPTFDVSKSDEHILAFGVKEADKLKQLGCGTKDLHNKKDPLLARQQLVLMKLTSNLDCDWARIVGTTTAGKMEPVGVGFLKGPDFNEPINVFGNTTGAFQWDTATFSFAGGAHGFLLRASLKGVISPIHTPWSTTVDTWQVAVNTGYTVRNGVKDSSNIIAGSFLGTLQAGALSFRSSTKGDVFVAKEAGKIAGSVVQWPHLQSVTVRDIALKWNKSGTNVEGVYVGGEFSGTMVLPNGLSLTSYGKKDIFVMFIDFSNGPGWTTHIGGVGDEWLQRLHVRIASPGIGIHVGGISESGVLYHDGASSKRSLAGGKRRMFIWNLRQ